MSSNDEKMDYEPVEDEEQLGESSESRKNDDGNLKILYPHTFLFRLLL